MKTETIKLNGLIGQIQITHEGATIKLPDIKLELGNVDLNILENKLHNKERVELNLELGVSASVEYGPGLQINY